MKRLSAHIVAPLLIAALLFVTAAACGALEPYDVKLAAATVQSTAAEAALLARGAAQAHSSAPYIRTHAQELANAAESTATQLRSAQVSSPLAGTVRELVRLSDVTAAELRRLAGAPKDRAAAASVAARCASLAVQAKKAAS